MKFIFSVLVLSLLGFEQGYSCSVMPLVPAAEAEQAKLQLSAIAAMGVTEATVETVSRSNEAAEFIWSGPMCPEGKWVSAEYTIVLRDEPGSLTTNCTAKVKVTKRNARAVMNGETLVHAAENSVLAEIQQGFFCLE